MQPRAGRVTGAAAVVACAFWAVAVVTMAVGTGGCGGPLKTPPLPALPPLPVPQAPPPPPQARIDAVMAAIGPQVRAHWQPYFRAAGLTYPPAELALLGFKRERRLELWGRNASDRPWARIDALPILAASGIDGPKLRQGDLQVPEGLYRVVAFNPNSRFHLSLMVDYPNADDLAVAATEGRTELGGEIFIHGGAKSIGCLALGDAAIENLFVLVADVGLDHVEVVLAPHDPRSGVPLAPIGHLPFTRELYQRITTRLASFREPGPTLSTAAPAL